MDRNLDSLIDIAFPIILFIVALIASWQFDALNMLERIGIAFLGAVAFFFVSVGSRWMSKRFNVPLVFVLGSIVIVLIEYYSYKLGGGRIVAANAFSILAIILIGYTFVTADKHLPFWIDLFKDLTLWLQLAYLLAVIITVSYSASLLLIQSGILEAP